ncbi:Uncharacterised protein [Vibrio cholerae]|nr:Uncharacterised protein [Vibrio cholerae]
MPFFKISMVVKMRSVQLCSDPVFFTIKLMTLERLVPTVL